MTGTEAIAAFNHAAQLVKEGRYDEARKVELLTSDRVVIEARIEAAISNGAKWTDRRP